MTGTLRDGHAPPGDVAEQVGTLGQGDHLCLIYEDPAEQMAAVVPFMRDGIARGECCAYIADDRTFEQVAAALAAGGVDVERERGRGALALMDKRESYLRSGEFEPAAMIDFLGETVERAAAEGFTAFRVTGEMTWALGPETGCDRLVEYEALLNRFFPGSLASAICQYNRRRFPPEMIRDVLRTHPVAILGDQVCPNLYYEPPEMILEQQSEEHRVAWMIEQLKRARAVQLDLATALREQTRLRREAEAAIRARDDFLSVAAHELKTPITSLKGYAQTVLREFARSGTADPVRIRRALAVIDDQSTRLGRLVVHLLDLARIDQGRFVLGKEDVDLAALVRGVAGRTRPLARRHEVVVDAPPSLRAAVDPLRIEQVVASLLDNAFRYSPDGTRIDVALRAIGGALELSVRDRGRGIDPEHRPRLFERLFQAHAGEHASGLGIGLHVSRHIIEAHGGQITAEFPSDGGSRFVVRLPV